MSVKIEGADALIKKLEQISQCQPIKANMGKAVGLVEGEARRKAPKDTGALKQSMSSKVEDKGGEIQGIVFNPLEYAAYVEYGTGLFAEKGGRKDVPWFYEDEKGKGHLTSGQHPHPYLRPALNENRDKIKKILVEGLFNV